MASLLLAVIYLAFISLGLPDSLLGSAWPSMYGLLQVPVSYAGVLTMIIAGGTILSSLFSSRVIARFGTGAVTTVSVAMTALALFGFSLSRSFAVLCVWGIPYGLGAGSVDAALNHYVALHYRARHMNWLHSFWGVGASLGPSIMGLCLAGGLGWTAGYRSVGGIQLVLVACLVLSLPLWRQLGGAGQTEPERPAAPQTNARGLFAGARLPGAKPTLVAFFCYCAMETTAGLWASSYMVARWNVAPETAAGLASLFYLGITAGRIVSGFVSVRMDDRRMVRMGEGMVLAGLCLMILPLGRAPMFLGLALIGLGCAPVYPSLLHETPANFGAEHSQQLMGMQMASAYTGSTLMPLVFGLLAQHTSLGLLPVYLLAFLLVMAVMTERATRTLRLRQGTPAQSPAES
ncbi:MAG: MFS transporter [Clostridiales bacterium]|nr:MFS transporter [Clostridiales bacterium]